jgi:ribonuclease P protein component
MSSSNYLTKEEIKETLKNGKRFSIKSLQIVYWKKEDVNGIAVVIPKKIASSSVKRNLIKRRFKESFRIILKNGKVTKGGIVLFCHSSNYSFKKCFSLSKEIINFIVRK